MITMLAAFVMFLPLTTASAVSMEPAGYIGDLSYDVARWQVERMGGAYLIRARDARDDDETVSGLGGQ